LGEWFFLVKKPGLDVVVIGGMVEEMHRLEYSIINETH